MTKLHYIRLAIIAAFASFSIQSCKENIDDSDYYTFTGEMMTDRFKNDPEFSMFYYLTQNVKLSNKSESTVADLLSARGNYTCFAPTNDAVQHYLDSIYETVNYDVTLTPDSTATDIVRSCIIECDRDDAYHTVDFVEGAIEKTNMNDRYLTVTFDVRNDMSVILINTWSMVVQKDIEVENGYIHAVDRVLSPTRALLPDLILDTPNMTLFGRFLYITGWEDQMRLYRDEEYEEDHPLEIPGVPTQGVAMVKCPEHRYYGYTAFIETDSVFNQYGIKDEISLMEFLQNPRDKNGNAINISWDANTTFDTNYTNENNAINQFVSYHLMSQRVPFDKLTISYNEYGSNRGTGSLGVNIQEYYRMMGSRNRLLKVTRGRNTDGNRINRHALMDRANFSETSVTREGIQISATNGSYDFNSMNGFYYAIDDILLYDDDVPNKVLNERIRFNVLACTPELMNIGIRRQMSSSPGIGIPTGYSENLISSAESHVNYLPGYNSNWHNYQGDEMNIVGQYDLTLKILPVPYSGTYELRFGVSANDQRGMAQVYLGTDPNNLPALGIPLDLRTRGTGTYINWVADTNDEETDEENEQMMKIHNYQKGPKYISFNPEGGTSNGARNNSCCLRKIIYRGHFDHTKTYYVRFKSVLESTTSQFFFNYLELVPRSVFNGEVAEDIW